MANRLQLAASRIFGLSTRDEVSRLETAVATLETRVRMAKSAASGVPITFGSFEYEYLSELSAHERWLVYDKMEADPRIKEGLDSVILPLTTAKWCVEPASDKKADKDVAEFVAANLLRESGDIYGREYWTETSWGAQRLREILDMRKSGFAMFAKSTREVNGKIVYDRLQWLEPASVDPHGWVLSETDEIIEIKRTYRTPNSSFKFFENIPAAQIALYVWDLKGARYEGRSAIRSIYGAWKRKDFLVRNAVIWAQKTGAPMPVGHYPANFPANLIPLVETAVQAARGQSPAESYAVFPMGANGEKVEIGFAGSDTGDVDRMRGLIDGENSEISHGSGTKQQLLGESKSGSRALGETVSADEDLATQAVADLICEMENHGIGNLPGLVQELVDWNFPNVKEYPRLRVSRIGPWEDMTTLDPLIKAYQAGLIPKVASVRKQVTEKFGITLTDADYEADPTPPVGVGPDGLPLPTPPAPNGKQPPQAGEPKQPAAAGGAQLSASDHKVARFEILRSKLAGTFYATTDAMPMITKARKGYGRAPTAFEASTCALAVISGTLTTGGEQVASAIRRIAAKMTEDILLRVEAGKITREDATGLRRSKPKGNAEMVSVIRERFLEVARAGKSHAQDELKRQKASLSSLAAGDPPTDEPPNVLPPGSKLPANLPMAKEIIDLIERAGGEEKVLEFMTAELAGEARVTAQITVDEIWARLLGEARRSYNDAVRSGLDEPAALRSVEAALHGLSPAPSDLAGRQVAEVAYNQGRDVAAKVSAVDGEAAWVIRSEVLDQATCEACSQLDGVEVRIGTAEYEQLMPPAQCYGGDNCRGFYVILSDGVNDAAN